MWRKRILPVWEGGIDVPGGWGCGALVREECSGGVEGVRRVRVGLCRLVSIL